jgi:putative ABC transport system permease protein
MNFYHTLLTALRDLSSHKFRAALATIGIVFGVASVQAMISISEGARRETLARIAILGVDNLIIRSVKPPKEEPRGGDTQQQRQIADYGLKRKDLRYIKQSFPGVRHIVGGRNPRREIFSPGVRTRSDITVIATESDYLRITRSSVIKGRWFNWLDEEKKAMICVVGQGVIRKLFEYREPVGSSIRIGNDWFTVIGVLHNSAALKDAGGDDINNQIFIPLTTSHSRYGDISQKSEAGSYEMLNIELDLIAIQLSDEHDVVPTSKRLENYLRLTHKQKDYDLLIPMELMRQKAATQRIFTVVMASIASISLLVGGIGIMNIMLANVSDRRKEIGTRRALGARRVDIVRQFLLEAATLTTLGGLAGVAVGYALARSISYWAQWPTIIEPGTILLSLGVSCVSGLAFGFWPAHQAAKVNPIEALRSD